MTGMPNLACSLCGLRLASRPFLEFHVREDHRQRGRRDPAAPRRPAPR
jgi:hypothetical protein